MVRSALKRGRPERHFSPDGYPVPFDESEHGVPALGEDALRMGHVAVLMPVGGLSTRMSGELRLRLAIGPVTDRSILRLQLERLAAVRNRYQARIPLIVVTSDKVDEETKALFEEHGDCGITPADLRFVRQPSLPVVDSRGEPVFLDDGRLLEAPAGHGSLVSAIASSGVIPWLRQQGIKLLYHFQYPNVMEQLCDPVLIGAHLRGEFEATVKAFRKTRAGEKVGRIVLSETGRLQVAEYHEIEQNDDWSWMLSLPANLGTYIWGLQFLERCIRDEIQLPFVATRHRSPDHEEEMWKAEQFIFDLLDHTHASGFVVVDREEQYGIVKYPEGDDSLASARDQLNRTYRSWLTSAGAITSDPEARVEISPLFALDREELMSKIEPGFRYGDGLVLQNL